MNPAFQNHRLRAILVGKAQKLRKSDVLSGIAKQAVADEVAVNLSDDILVNGRMDKLAGYFDGDNYLQHNPAVADGLSGLGSALAAMAKAGVSMKYERVHKTLGEGNFVLVISEGQFAGKHVAFYDLFRVQDNKIAEHWDTIEPIPPQSEWKNTNGKFGF